MANDLSIVNDLLIERFSAQQVLLLARNLTHYFTAYPVVLMGTSIRIHMKPSVPVAAAYIELYVMVA